MSRAFVKEGDSDEDLPERPSGDGPNYVTPEGYAALKRRHDDLVERRSALEPSSPEFRRVERDLRYFERRLSQAVVVERSGEKPGEARFGALVVVRDEAGERAFRIVGEDEAEPSKGSLAWSSPLALAVMGAKPGDEVHWQGPQGRAAARVVSVSYP